MKIGFISQSFLKDSLDRFKAAAKKKGIELVLLNPAPFTIQIKKGKLVLLDANLKTINIDGIINWEPYPAFRELEQVCSWHGIPFKNSTDAIFTARNKILTSQALFRKGLPQPETFYLNKYASKLPSTLPLPIVYKPQKGTQGRGIRKFTTKNSLQNFIRTSRHKKEVCLQEFIPNDFWDLRVIVIGNKVLGATKRVAKAGEWKTSALFGGKLQPSRLNKTVADLALNASSALKLDFAGIDIIQNNQNKSFVVLEVNAIPRLKTFEDTTGLSITTAILEHMIIAVNGK